MNTFDLHAHRIPGFRHLALIPLDNVQQCTIRRRLFKWIKFPFPTTRKIQIRYHIEKAHDKPDSEYILKVSFHKIGVNTVFISREAAELWFGKKIEISELVNSKIAHLKNVHMEKTTHCHTCDKIHHKEGLWDLEIPQPALIQGRIPPIEISGMTCELCGNKITAEFYQSYNEGDRDITVTP